MTRNVLLSNEQWHCTQVAHEPEQSCLPHASYSVDASNMQTLLVTQAYRTWAYRIPVPFGSVQNTLCTRPTITSLPPDSIHFQLNTSLCIALLMDQCFTLAEVYCMDAVLRHKGVDMQKSGMQNISSKPICVCCMAHHACAQLTCKSACWGLVWFFLFGRKIKILPNSR